MHGRSSLCLLAFSWLLLSPTLLGGQSDRSRRTPDTSDRSVALPRALQPRDPTFALRQRWPVAPGTIGFPGIIRAAGTIFSGTVTAIARRPATHGQSVETVSITFRVERAIRGATPGESLTISQWIGLWSSGQRYHMGERVLLFLYPTSKLGLTSCVAGPMGRFGIDRWGHVSLSAWHGSAFRTDPILAGKSRVDFISFSQAVRKAGGEE